MESIESIYYQSDESHLNELQLYKDSNSTYVAMDSKNHRDSPSDLTIAAVGCDSNSRAPHCSTAPPNPRRRAILNADAACTIYRMRPHSTQLPKVAPNHTITGCSVLVAHMFDVSPKTVRDIWNLRTWCHVTEAIRFTAGDRATTASHYLSVQLSSATRTARPIGRPRGSKDSHPRRRTSPARRAAASQGQACILPSPPPTTPPPMPSTLASTSCTGRLWLAGLESDTTWVWATGGRCGAPPPTAAHVDCPPSPPPPPAEDDSALRRCFPFFLGDQPGWP